MADYSNTSTQYSDPSTFELPYGKYAGKQISDAPTQYLRWMYRDCDFSLFPELQRALEAYLGLPVDPTIRLGKPPAQAPVDPASGRPTGPKSGSNGGHQGLPETGLDGFRAAFDRTKREAVLEFNDDPELLELVEDLFARVRRALGI